MIEETKRFQVLLVFWLICSNQMLSRDEKIAAINSTAPEYASIPEETIQCVSLFGNHFNEWKNDK